MDFNEKGEEGRKHLGRVSEAVHDAAASAVAGVSGMVSAAGRVISNAMTSKAKREDSKNKEK